MEPRAGPLGAVIAYGLLVGLAVCGCAHEPEAAQRPTDASPQPAESRPAATRVDNPCGPLTGSPLMTHQVAAFTSLPLQAVMPVLHRALESAGTAAHGTRPWGGERNGIAGASFGSASYQLGVDACVEELKAMSLAVLSPGGGPAAPVAADARPLPNANASTIGTAFDAWRGRTAEDERAIATLALVVQEQVHTHAGLSVVEVRGETAVARNAGVTLVDKETREALWLFSRAVRMSTGGRAG